MLKFDSSLFYDVYNKLLQEYSFKEIFHTVFSPLLEEIGVLWQTNTITPAHEHFISLQIRQKILINIEKIQPQNKFDSNPIFILFLPLHEIHDIGLLYINYEIIRAGYQTIFLGQNIPIESLKSIPIHEKTHHFISYFTIKPDADETIKYLESFYDSLLKNTNHSLSILGQKTLHLKPSQLPDHIHVFSSIENFIKDL